MKQYSDACDQNKNPILSILRDEFSSASQVLEIGSGSGQHAVFFARELPHLRWQASDRTENHPSIKAWISETGLTNVVSPLDLDVLGQSWPTNLYDGVFSANTSHIMSWAMVEHMFEGIGRVLAPGASLCLYGPFNYNHVYTSPSNERFDAWLKGRDPDSGLRDFEDLDALANINDLRLKSDHEMPVNNRLLVWVKQDGL